MSKRPGRLPSISCKAETIAELSEPFPPVIPPTGRRLNEPGVAETAATPEPGIEEDPNDSGIESNSGNSHGILERGESDVFEPENLNFSKLRNKTEHIKSSDRPLGGR